MPGAISRGISWNLVLTILQIPFASAGKWLEHPHLFETCWNPSICNVLIIVEPAMYVSQKGLYGRFLEMTRSERYPSILRGTSTHQATYQKYPPVGSEPPNSHLLSRKKNHVKLRFRPQHSGEEAVHPAWWRVIPGATLLKTSERFTAQILTTHWKTCVKKSKTRENLWLFHIHT